MNTNLNNVTENNAPLQMTTLVIHGGVFHADDVLCAALALAVNPRVKIVRSNRPTPEQFADPGTIVADIGGGEFDHHQSDAKLRVDGHKRAACGLLFEAIWPALFGDEDSARAFEMNYIIPIEDCDNGVSKNPLSQAVGAFNAQWDESDTNADKQFAKAVEFVSQMLSRELKAAESRNKALDYVRDYLAESDGHVVVMGQFVPWQGILCPSTAEFVIYPSLRGGCNLQCIPSKPGETDQKIPLPEDWLSEKPTGCTFVHPGRFLAAFETIDAAVQAAYAILITEDETAEGGEQ